MKVRLRCCLDGVKAVTKLCYLISSRRDSVDVSRREGCVCACVTRKRYGWVISIPGRSLAVLTNSPSSLDTRLLKRSKRAFLQARHSNYPPLHAKKCLCNVLAVSMNCRPEALEPQQHNSTTPPDTSSETLPYNGDSAISKANSAQAGGSTSTRDRTSHYFARRERSSCYRAPSPQRLSYLCCQGCRQPTFSWTASGPNE